MTGVHFKDARGPDGVVIYAIGDVHGRLDLLTRMHEAIAADRSRRAARDWRIIHLGDYVDRGPDSKGVIEFLIRACEADGRVVALAGNHDIGFLEFLADAARDGLFAHNGGTETARSYGVEIDFDGWSGFEASHRALTLAVPRRHIDFLRSLKFSITMGDFFFCHAGIRPGIALDQQAAFDLIWIRTEFHQHLGLHRKVIVHGHTPVPEPEVLANRVNIDTGAFLTDRLTALVIDGAKKRIMPVEV